MVIGKKSLPYLSFEEYSIISNLEYAQNNVLNDYEIFK